MFYAIWIICCVSCIIYQFIVIIIFFFIRSSGLLFWYPEIVNQLAENERKVLNNPITVCEAISAVQYTNSTESTSCSDGVDPSVFEQNLIIGGAYAVGFIVISLVVNKLGKRSLLSMTINRNS